MRQRVNLLSASFAKVFTKIFKCELGRDKDRLALIKNFKKHINK